MLYTYDDGTVSVDNVGERDRHGLSVVSNVYGVDGALLDHQTASGVSVDSQGVARDVLNPAVPATTTPPTPSKTYFVELLLERHGKVIDRNVYWLSTQQDIVDWDATIGQPQATMTQFANLSQLQALPAAAVRVQADTVSERGGLEKTVVRITNTSNKPTVANVGGAWAFESEASAGHTVPTLDSIHRFLSPLEQDMLWQSPDYNQYHANYEPDLPGPDNGGYSFGTLHDLDAAISNRYGAWSSLSQYVQEAQVQNYETQRSEFEAYIDHSTNKDAPSTGVVYWQLNKGWPTLLWDLYNNDYDQAGSYFGAKKANEPLHVLYTYDDGTVSVDNVGERDRHGLSVVSNVYGVDGALLDHQTASGVSVDSQGVARDVLNPAVPATTTPPTPSKTYFVELLLERHGKVIDRNVYWLSTQQDIVDWDATIGQPQATMTQFANLSQLQALPAAAVRVRADTVSEHGGLEKTVVRITNTSNKPTVAFFLRADVRRGNRSGTPAAGDNEVLPISWSDNDVTLWPGESETLHATYRRADLHGSTPVVSVSAWNSPLQDVPAS